MGLVERLKAWWSGPEGSYRGPAVGYSHWGNAFPIPFGDGYQAGLTLDQRSAQSVPIAYACVMATAKAVATCPAAHKVVLDSGKHQTSTTSPASRVLRKPNAYQTWPQFILDCVATMLFEGEAFVLLLRDDRYAVNAMHLMPRRACSPYIEPLTGDLYYSIGTNPMLPAEIDAMAPARDILHLRQHTPRHPLIGESPLTAAALALGVNVALAGNQAAFFANMNRPSGVLSSPEPLTKDQMKMLREAFDEQSQGPNAGKIPVLGRGLTFSQMAISSQDAQLIEAQRMSIEDVARCFGVPLPMVGDLSKATLNNVEAMTNFWLAHGLGSLLENLERSFDAAFNLPANEYVEFDERALLRMDYKSRIDAITKAIQGGVMSPNEARDGEGLPPVAGGNTLFLQQQMVSIDMLAELHAAEIASKNRPAAETPPAPDDEDEEEPDQDDEEEKRADPLIAKALVVDMRYSKRKAA
jgi:HK97 family phage portal protein